MPTEIVSHTPVWEPTRLPVDEHGNTAPGFVCIHPLENGNGLCGGNVFGLDDAVGDHCCVVKTGVEGDGNEPGNSPAENSVRALHAISGLSWADIARIVGVGPSTVHRWAAGIDTGSHRHERVEIALAEFRALPIHTAETVSHLAGELTRRFAAESGPSVQGPDAPAWFNVPHDRVNDTDEVDLHGRVVDDI